MWFCSFRSADALACDPASETLSAGGKTHVVAETRDAFGRFVGYVYSKNGAAQQTVSASYEAATGRFAGAGFLHGALGRPTSRTLARGGATRTDAFGYGARSELTSATLGNAAYGYGFDEAGNRDAASEAGRLLTYTTNALNQYASVSEGEVPFVPEYDLDGNATRLRTSTGTWSVEYNAHNRPVAWRKTTGEVVYMIYDAQGRRAEKRVLNASGKRTLRERYVYVGYTCVQVLNGDKNNALVKEFAWDPTEPEATRPLTFRHAEKGLMLFYAFDGNKNVSDLFFFALQNGIGAHYEYAPFGAIVRTAKATGSKVDLIGANPRRFSSEFYDSELDLVYYNYRHYSPALGRWLSRDPIEEQGGLNLYAHCENNPIGKRDILGRAIPQLGAGPDVEAPQPPKPDRTERIRAFEKWIEEEAKDLTWLDKIPACPKKLSCKEEEKSISIVYPNGSVCVTKVKGLFCNSPDPSRWALTSDLLFHCFSESGHPGGKYELRTIPKDEYGGAGNQCIYDESGNLVEMHPTAGTADKYSPGSGILDGIIRAPKHNLVDVRPFKEAQYLDRNCGGNGIYEQKYYTVRPAK